jgi:hypothetical protein
MRNMISASNGAVASFNPVVNTGPEATAKHDS